MEKPGFYIRENFVDIAYDKARQALSQDAIRREAFADLYDPEQIERDSQLVAQLEKNFASRHNPDSRGHHLATVFEAIIHQHGEQSEWFGPHSHTIKTDLFDDYVNGVDESVEFIEPQKPNSHLALAIDATFNGDQLGTELRKILAKIEKGKMAEIKYFESSDGTFRGQLHLIPQVILCADEKTIIELADHWINEPRRLAKHPIIFQLLESAIEELTFFADFASHIGQEKISDRYRNAISILKPLLEEKRGSVRDTAEKRDAIFYRLLAHLELLRREILS